MHEHRFIFHAAAQREQRLIAWLMTQVDGFQAEAMLMRHFIALGDAIDADNAAQSPMDPVDGMSLLMDILKETAVTYARAVQISEMWRAGAQARNEALILEHLNDLAALRFDTLCRMWCTAAGCDPADYEADSWGNAPDTWIEAAIKGLKPGE